MFPGKLVRLIRRRSSRRSTRKKTVESKNTEDIETGNKTGSKVTFRESQVSSLLIPIGFGILKHIAHILNMFHYILHVIIQYIGLNCQLSKVVSSLHIMETRVSMAMSFIELSKSIGDVL